MEVIQLEKWKYSTEKKWKYYCYKKENIQTRDRKTFKLEKRKYCQPEQWACKLRNGIRRKGRKRKKKKRIRPRADKKQSFWIKQDHEC